MSCREGKANEDRKKLMLANKSEILLVHRQTWLSSSRLTKSRLDRRTQVDPQDDQPTNEVMST